MKKIIVILLIFNLLIMGCSSKKNEINKAFAEEKVATSEENKAIEEAMKNQENQKIKAYNTYYFKQYELVNGTMGDFVLEAYDKDGELLWNKKWTDLALTELSLASRPAVKDNNVYIGVYGTLYAIDGETGEELWSAKDIGSISKPYINKDRVYVSGYYGPFLTCVDIHSGKQIWQYNNEDMYWPTGVLEIDGKIVVEYEDSNDGIKLATFNEDGTLVSAMNGSLSEKIIRWEKVEASSVLDSNFKRYGAGNISDKRNETAWVEGVKGYGINEWIKMESSLNKEVNEIKILNGYHKTIETYENNGRLKKVRLDFSNDEYLICETVDKDKESLFSRENITLAKPINTDFIKLTILDTFEGKKYQDTCISEIIAK
ncbi:PQQ-binding-like beta-propeller repeat protein [Wukongibacter baidiensis]|uniref:NADase-type glycan-binding domain-containing protein n=1 Tax=Wukongibacter baidiensis TaxID=1723361 RepID=UPI003D7FE4AA